MRRSILFLVISTCVVPNFVHAQFDIPQFSLSTVDSFDNVVLVDSSGQMGTPPVTFDDMAPYIGFFTGKNSMPDSVSVSRSYSVGSLLVDTNVDEQSAVNCGGIVNVGAIPYSNGEYSVGYQQESTWVIYDPLNYSSTNDATFDLVLDAEGLATEGTNVNYKLGITIDDPFNPPVEATISRAGGVVTLSGLGDYGVTSVEIGAYDPELGSFSLGTRVELIVPLNTRITIQTGLASSYVRGAPDENSQALSEINVALQGKSLEVD